MSVIEVVGIIGIAMSVALVAYGQGYESCRRDTAGYLDEVRADRDWAMDVLAAGADRRHADGWYELEPHGYEHLTRIWPN